jgi:glycosyltransferase involved in cell wall biosynthesis
MGAERRAVDGIICLGGEDWWYHNRGHFDFQVMRRLAMHVPVLFVNSIGVRIPSPGHGGAQFVGRLRRKLSSFARGLVEAECGFWVMSPLSIPGRPGRVVTNPALALQIRAAARRIGITNPLLWVHCPPGADLIDRIPHQALVFQRTDRFEAFPEGDAAELTRQVAFARARADVTVYCARSLMQEETQLARDQVLIDHGIDADMFVTAGRSPSPGPDDIAALPRPRAVFVGGIDAHTFDPELFLSVARALPDVAFPMVGDCSLPAGWCPLPNVHFLGRKPYTEVARYMAAADVLLMPWNTGEWIRACNPIKLKEYLATGRPVVSTSFPELAPFVEHVCVANSASEFAAAIRQALASPGDAEARRSLVARETWDAKVVELLDALWVRGIAIGDYRPTIAPSYVAA